MVDLDLDQVFKSVNRHPRQRGRVSLGLTTARGDRFDLFVSIWHERDDADVPPPAPALGPSLATQQNSEN